MKNIKALSFMALAAEILSAPTHYEGDRRSHYSSTPLNKKQKKRRFAEKAARKSRKINRR